MTDLRFGARMLRKSPGSTLAIAGLLALGIGAATVIFSVFDAVLLRPLPVRHPEELVRVVQRLPRIGTRSAFSAKFYESLRDHSTTLASVFGETSDVVYTMTEPGPAEQVLVHMVTPEFFEALGVPALHGRVLMSDDGPAAVLSYEFWQRRFDGDPAAVGSAVTVHGTKFAITGVMPREFNGLRVDTAPAMWVPRRVNRLMVNANNGYAWDLSGRLKPGATLAQAEAECQSLWKAFDEQDATPLEQNVALDSLERGVSILRDRFGDALKLLMAAVGLLLLIVCSNVAGLLLARGAGRRQEIAVRLAVGATPLRLIRQMLLEDFLLGVLGAVGGLWIAMFVTPLAGRALPPMRDLSATLLPVSIDVRMNGRVFLFALALSLLTMLLFSLAPAISASRSSLDSVLRGARASGGWRGRQILIACQIALCTFMLAGASLFVRTFEGLRWLDPGFDSSHIATFSLNIAAAGYTKETAAAFISNLTQRVREIPGVVSVAVASRGIMRMRGVASTVARAGERPSRADFLNVSTNSVSPEYFDTMGMRVLSGRGLIPSDATDAKPQKVLVNEAFVRRFFPNVDPLGQRFGVGAAETVVAPDFEIVGVVNDAKYRSLREPMIPLSYAYGKDYGSFVLNVRTRVRPEEILEPVRKALASIDPGLPFLEVHTLSEEAAGTAALERLTAVLASVFGGLAALLAGVGLHGLLAYAVTQRRREIGIRMALGAAALDIAGLTVRQTVVMAVGGLAVGLGAALACGPLVRSLLYGVSPWDLTSLGAAVGFVLVVAALATVVPAWRAAGIEPSVALREEN
jgi:predicted permease